MKRIILSLFIICLQNLYGQNVILKANGELVKLNGKKITEAIVGTKVKSGNGEFIGNVFLDANIANPKGIIDTLSYTDHGIFNTNFGFFDQDIMFQYFVAPADMIIKAAGFSTSDDAGSANATVSLRLLKLNWTYEQLISVPAPLNLGFYPEIGDGLGGIDPFGEVATGNWTDLSGGLYPLPPWTDTEDPGANTYDYDLWGDIIWWPVSPVASPLDAKVYQWVNMSYEGPEPKLLKGEVFAVALTHDGTNPAFTDRIGFWADNSIGIPAWKYYENGRFEDGSGKGWWVRQYTWDFVVAADLTGDRGPIISDLSRAITTYENNPKLITAKITDDNPSGGDSGVKEAFLNYSIDNSVDIQKIKMVNDGNIYSAEIPPQERGQYISYYVEASDISGNITSSRTLSYTIPPNNKENTLIIFNGGTEEDANKLAPLYIQNSISSYDLWAAYGPISNFINFYKTVIEIASMDYPEDDNWAFYYDFLKEGNKNLAIIGQEVLGNFYYWDSILVEGDIAYDILGIKETFVDVTTSNGLNSNKKPSKIFALENSAYGDILFEWLKNYGEDTLKYDPYRLYQKYNWMDQFEPRDDINSDVFIESVAGDDSIRPVGHTFTDNKNNRIFFMSIDPLAITTDSVWVGNSELSPLVQFLKNIVVSVDGTKEDQIPNEFSLSQNYPNPFNPTTTIEYSIPRDVKRETANVKGTFIPIGAEGEKVQLVVYDLLGRAVKTLVNKVHSAGNYTIQFDGSKLNSGVYFYQLKAGKFIQTKKMLLLK